jgi:hypothetical protein
VWAHDGGFLFFDGLQKVDDVFGVQVATLGTEQVLGRVVIDVVWKRDVQGTQLRKNGCVCVSVW